MQRLYPIRQDLTISSSVFFASAEKRNSLEHSQFMLHDYWYLFECDYASRVKEKKFIKAILCTFDKDFATMVGITVNNNPYCLQFSIGVNIQGDPLIFEQWLRQNYSEKLRRHNVFLSSTLVHNSMTFTDDWQVDLALTEHGGSHPFLLPERDFFERTNPQYMPLHIEASRVFISHSSKDKIAIVNPLYSYLQANDVGVWLDSFEIDYGDNIYLKVNEGIEQSKVGLFVLTDSFFDNASGWPMTEFSAYFMELMKSKKKILMINAGVAPERMHALMRVFRYIEWNNGAGLPEVANAVRKLLNT